MLEKWWKTMLLRLHINNSSISYIDYLPCTLIKHPPKESNLGQGIFIWVILCFQRKVVSAEREHLVCPWSGCRDWMILLFWISLFYSACNPSP